MRISALILLPVLALAACGTQSRMTPVSSVTPSSGSASREPESTNSLPRGAAVSGPLTGSAGDVSTTRVGPRTVP